MKEASSLNQPHELLVLHGTRGTDRIKVWVTLNTGSICKVIDRLLPCRSRA